jgi:hypothetical protein
VAYVVNVGAFLEVSIQGQVAGQTCLTILHYRLDTAPTGGLPDGASALVKIASAFEDSDNVFLQSYLNVLSQDYTLDQVVYQWIKPIRYVRLARQPVPTLKGNVEVESLPPATSVVITKQGGSEATKGGHGAMHLPAVPNTFVSNGSITATAKDFYVGTGSDLSGGLSFMVGTTNCLITPVIYKRKDPGSSQDWVASVVQYAARTMYRRVVGRGV